MPCVYCVLCGNRDKSVSYYAFPKEEDIRKQWLAFCGINEHVLNTVTKLCGNHFREEDMIKKVKRSYLKPNIVPSIYGKKKKRSLQFDSFNNKIYSKKKKEYIATDSVNVDCNILIKDTSVTVNECIPQSIENAQLNCQTSLEAEPQPCVDIIEISDSTVKADTLLKVVNDGLSTSPLPSSRRNEDVYCSTFQTSTQAIQEPRYIGDITAQHLSTPRKAQRALKLARDTIARQQRKIKSLQQCRNRLVTRIATLKNLVKHLEQKNLLTEVAAEHLKVNESNLKTLSLMNTFKSKNLCSN